MRAARRRPGGDADLRDDAADGRRPGDRHRTRRIRVRARLRARARAVRAQIIENQAIAFALADMKIEIDAARLLVWRASWMGRTGSRSGRRGLDEQAQGRRGRALGAGAARRHPRARGHADERAAHPGPGRALVDRGRHLPLAARLRRATDPGRGGHRRPGGGLRRAVPGARRHGPGVSRARGPGPGGRRGGGQRHRWPRRA